MLGVGVGELGLDVAVMPDGDVLVVLLHDTGEFRGRTRDVRVLTVPRGGRPGPAQRLGPHHGFASADLVVAPTGRAVIAWKAFDQGMEVNHPIEVWAATRAAGARRFRRAQRLEGNGVAPVVGTGNLSLAVGADGAAVLAWSAPTRYYATLPVEVASAPPAGRFGRPQVVASSGIHVDVALTSNGRAVLTWAETLDDNPTDGVQVFAAMRPFAAAPFGPPEQVSPVERAEDPAVAYDPSTGQPMIVWSGAPGSPPGDDADGRTGRRSLSFARYVP